jgi:signal transduction histidine kinase
VNLPIARFPLRRSLSARILVLTVVFVMLAEVFIFAPSVGRFRQQYIADIIEDSHLAAIALEVAPEAARTPELVARLLQHARAQAVVRYMDGHPRRVLIGDMPARIAAAYDMREAGFFALIGDALAAMVRTERRIVLVIGASARDGGTVMIEAVIDEGRLCEAMQAFAWRILGLSLIISFFAAVLVYLSLHWLLVRPLRRITDNMASFRDRPDDPAALMQPTSRGDEIGFAERELRTMQLGLRQALRQQEHLAALGVAVTKINHDLRNMLSSAQLVSDRFADSADPKVRKVAPMLLRSLDRAAALCGQTLDFARGHDIKLEEQSFDLGELADEAFAAHAEIADPPPRLVNEIPPGFRVRADRAQLYRVFANLVRNAIQAGSKTVTATARRGSALVIDVSDDGPGVPDQLKETVFEPFASGRKGGFGLGLAIARDIAAAHGGSIRLVPTPAGTQFRIELPRG